MLKRKLVYCNSAEIVDLVEATLERLELDADETTVSELISELKGQDK